ncbi:mediator of RNA polymerase II transcription subunit 17 [Diplogelasinospora grovesii]|uniref:Mediator of RNA polymerase II transcription subunit 17 n=1 Tax=Diplogelasinospora grovesii TaxID=303347 RepID=A0AAN6N0M9_9PEZI|nr:mediator of RNA polymerase II transcription subunit 17 [Diplogelasinospora grovesii]
MPPRPPPPRRPKKIAEFIQRINAEPGGFRALNQAELRKEIAAKAQQDEAKDEIEMEDAPEAEGGVKPKDILAARDELLRNIHSAHQSSMLTLDFISLLISKENPAQATSTLSQGLRSMVGIGTLGSTKLVAPTHLSKSRVPENKMMAIGKRLVDLHRAADTALSTAEKMRQEISLETKYWAEVLAVSEDGWATFRLPNERHTMGVRFGFSSAAPEFKAHGVAPMRRAADGTVRLEFGAMGGASKRVRVTISHQDKVVGQSYLPPPLPEDAPLHSRVVEASNSIFAQELWHELNREGRTLLARNVLLERSAVVCPLGASRTISFRLVTLGQSDAADPGVSGPEDEYAETINTALWLLLANAHRQSAARRSEPLPRGANRGPPQPYPILLPILSYLQHEKTLEQCTRSLAALASVLRSAGVDSSYTVTELPLAAYAATVSDSVLAALLNPPPVQFDLTITPESRLRILTRTTPQLGMTFWVYPLPPIQDGEQNPLAILFPPVAGDPFYDNTTDLFWYLYDAVPRALAFHYLKAAVQQSDPSVTADSQDPPTWVLHANGRSLVDYDTEEYGIEFGFELDEERGDPELYALAHLREGGEDATKAWTWPLNVGKGEEKSGDLGEIVKQVLSCGPES